MRPVASPLTRLVFVVAAASILVVTSATIAPAASVRGASAPDQIVLRGSVVVPRGADVGEVVVLRGSARPRCASANLSPRRRFRASV